MTESLWQWYNQTTVKKYLYQSNPMKILNIHGYRGSCENSSFAALSALGAEMISPQIDYDKQSPDEILLSLNAYAVF